MDLSLDRIVHEPSGSDGRRIVAVVAHPDDEVLGCGVLLSRTPGASVIHITDGAPRQGGHAERAGFATPQAYAEARRVELETAMALAGIGPERLLCLGIADQEASHNLAAVARRLVPLLRDKNVVLTHAYEGGHPDHDATAFAVHAACAALGGDAPLLVEMPFYRASPNDWLRQEFEPRPDAGPEVVLELTDDQCGLKRKMYEAHASQADILSGFPIGTERFRVAPAYAFEALPNAGLILYERYGWGLTGAGWIAQVRAARAQMSGPA